MVNQALEKMRAPRQPIKKRCRGGLYDCRQNDEQFLEQAECAPTFSAENKH